MSKALRQAMTWTIPMLFVLFYALWPRLGLLQPYYAPKLRQILWDRPAGVITQGWYGRLIMAGGSAILLGVLLAWVCTRIRPGTWQKYGAWLAVAATLVAMVLTAVHEIHRWML